MTNADLNAITVTDWLISLWPLWLIMFGCACGVLAKWMKP